MAAAAHLNASERCTKSGSVVTERMRTACDLNCGVAGPPAAAAAAASSVWRAMWKCT
jgi:hypothetical protein